MPRKTSRLPRPTDAELAILRVLWECGPVTVRDALAAVNARRREPLAYTTVLKFLQIMTEKGLVSRTEKDRAHLYRAAVPQAQTKRHLVRDLMERLFDGSAHELVLEALGAHKVSPKELREIRRLLDEFEKRTP